MVERWQLWITGEAVCNQLHGNNDIITHYAKISKFFCVWMSRVVQKKAADELKLKNLGRIMHSSVMFAEQTVPMCRV